MSNKPIRIKRGLDHLLSSSKLTAAYATTNAGDKENISDLRYIPIDQIQPGKYQPRKEMDPDALEELTNSIRTQGILQPVVLRTLAANQYEIIAGERRWRASKLAGLDKIPAIIKEASDEVTMALALIENIQREDLSPIEECQALQRLIDECGLTHQQAADAVGKSRVTISNLLRLSQLDPEVKSFLEKGDIELGHAKVLLGVDSVLQIQAARQVVSKKLSVRQTEQLIQKMQAEPVEKAMVINSDMLMLEKDLSDKLGVATKIVMSSKHKGKLVIHYKTLDELDYIITCIK